MSDIPEWLNDNEYTKDLDEETKQGILRIAQDLENSYIMSQGDAVKKIRNALRMVTNDQ